MPTTITFFPVGNGDMTLIQFGDDVKTTLLIDCNIRTDADDPNKDMRDVAKDLRGKLNRDGKGRPYVDAFLWSHPDKDHCTGITRHFHFGALSDYADDKKEDKEKKIVIRELWSSPMVFKRASKYHTLCDEAKALNAEAKRRVNLNKKNAFKVGDGDRIQIMGEDTDGNTDDVMEIVRKVDTNIDTINGTKSKWFTGLLLGPMEAKNDKEEEEMLAKNNSSVLINFTLAADANTPDGAKFLSGGDAEVFVWEKLWGRLTKKKSAKTDLEYDLLQTPHHCSWHSLSYDSWSKKNEKAVASPDARSALSQTRAGAIIVASSDEIKDDDNDPPCFGAKKEYVKITDEAKGTFFCMGEYPDKDNVAPLEFTVTKEGVQPPGKKESGSKAAAFISTSTKSPMPHGQQ